MSLTHRRACRAHTTGSPQKDDQANREAECGQQTSADHPNIVHSDKADHRTRSTCQGGRQKHESNHSRDLNHPRKPNHSNDFTHPNYSNQRNDSHLYNSNQPNDSNPSTNLSYPNRSSLFKSRCLAGYLALICVHLAQAAPLSSNPSNLINLNDHVNPNPLNQFLKEPDLVKVYKDRVVFHIFPLAKKDVEIRWALARLSSKSKASKRAGTVSCANDRSLSDSELCGKRSFSLPKLTLLFAPSAGTM